MRLRPLESAFRPAPLVSARAFFERALQELQKRSGVKIVVFDVDNTLADTRPRTVAAAHNFGRRYAIPELAKVTLEQVGVDGTETCARLGLSADVARRFQAFWLDFFWRPESIRLDLPVRETIELAWRARASGAMIIYATGRVASRRVQTLLQLQRFGVPDAVPGNIICKPHVGMHTSTFKVGLLERLRALGAHIAWFASDSRSEVAFIQQHTSVPAVLVDFPVDVDQGPVRVDTPVLVIADEDQR